MTTIYEPKPGSPAREYSPLALNIYSGCDHGCTYCYNKRFDKGEAVPRKGLTEALLKYLRNHEVKDQVLLSFLGDPYPFKPYFPNDSMFTVTSQVLQLLYLYDVPTSILTKGGTRCLGDLSFFDTMTRKGIVKVGASLTFPSGNSEWQDIEPYAASPEHRIDALKTLHNYHVPTWVSLEPIISEEYALQIIQETHEFVDEYRFGKLNYAKIGDVDWNHTANAVVDLLMKYDKKFYIKKNLQGYVKDLPEWAVDPDYLALRRE